MHLILYILYDLCIFLLCFLFLVAIYYYYLFFTAKYYLHKLPQVPQVPILGGVIYYPSTRALYSNMLNYPKKYGRTYWGMAGIQPILCTSDAKLLEVILSSSQHIDKPYVYKKIFNNVVGKGLVVGNGDSWRVQRKLMTPTFHFKILEQFMKIFNKHSNEFIDALGATTGLDTVDILPLTKVWALEQATETVMGLKPDGTSDNTTLYKEAGRELLQIAMERVIRPFEYIDYTYYFSRNYWRQLKVAKTLNDHIRSVIRRKEKEYDDGILELSNKVNEDGTKEKTVSLDLLIEYQRNGAQLTEDEMKEQVQTILFAGYDTTAATVTLAIHNFAKYPEVQEKVFEDVYHVLGGVIDQEITSAQLQEMKYLDMFLKESLRVKSSVPFIARELYENVEWEGTTLPKGLTVVMTLCAVHDDPEYFPEPEKFIPERFTPENCKERPPYAYVPFSAGPRNCIGQKYGVLATKVALAKLVLNYKFLWVGHELDLASEIVLNPKTGVKVAIRRRDLSKV